MSCFDTLGLHPNILEAIAEAGYTQPTPIQLEAIPVALKKVDIRASAQTGTGKTAAFILPALHLLASSPPSKGMGPRILILVPTRELATQVAAQAKTYGKHLPHLKTLCMIGGVPYHAQKRLLQKPYDILIATPGRLLDYVERGTIKLSRVEMLILDEADRMLDMGFIDAVEQIAELTPETRQTLLFSATLSDHILKLSENLMKEPHEIFVETTKSQKDNIAQRLHYTDDLDHKNRLLDHILQESEVVSAIVFTSTKQHAGELVEQLHDAGHAVAALHGDMHQRQRSRTIDQLRKGSIRILVATDVAARGIDVPAISHVINFDLPRNIEDYVHRIGRTGRAGAKGIALSFAGHRESSLVQRIEKFTGQDIECVEIPGLEPKARHTKKAPHSKRPFKQTGGAGRRYDSKPRYSNESRGEGSYGRGNDSKPRYSNESRGEGSYGRRNDDRNKGHSRPSRSAEQGGFRSSRSEQGKSNHARKFTRVFNTPLASPASRKKSEFNESM